MFSNKVFQAALLASFIVHGAIIFQNFTLTNLAKMRPEQKLEVRYVKAPQETKPEQKISKPAKKEPFLKLPLNVTLAKRIPPPFIDKESIFRAIGAGRQSQLTKPAFLKPDIIPVKKKITLPPLDMDKISNPSYIHYYQIVREKIRRSAYYNYTRAETGEVYVSFIILSDGALKDVRLGQDKSSPNQYLKDIALRSMKDASPFPNFPKELDYPQLSFNVIISFEIE